jgi:hypothetical protein
MRIAMKSLLVLAAGLAALGVVGTSAHAQTPMTKQTAVGSATSPAGIIYVFPSPWDNWGNLIRLLHWLRKHHDNELGGIIYFFPTNGTMEAI